MKPRFLLDENVDPAIQRSLIRLNFEVEIVCIGEPFVPPKGTLDPEILIWIEENDYILVTNNRASMPVHVQDHLSAGRHFLGILSIRPNSNIRQLVDELYLIWEASEAEEYYDIIQHIPL